MNSLAPLPSLLLSAALLLASPAPIRAQLAAAPAPAAASTTAAPPATPALTAADSVFADAPRETLDLAAGPLPFRLFDAAFYQNQVFLLGESHGVGRLQDLDFELLRHLNQRAGVRHYLAEVDGAKAYFLNQYLRTGDEATLRRVFASWIRTQQPWGNADFEAKIRRIRALNQSLPPARRIRFVGIDGVQDFGLMADYLAALRRAGRPLPPPLTAALDSVQTQLRAAPERAADVALRAQKTLSQGQAETTARRALGGQGYDEVRLALTTIGYARTLPNRESQLFANYAAALKVWHLQNEKLYGLWGLGHVLQSPALGNYVCLAARIRQSSLPGHESLVSILTTYTGCRMMTASAELPAAWRTPGQAYTALGQFNHDGPLVRLQGMEYLKKTTASGSTTLFWLAAPGAAARRLPVQLSYAPGVPANQQLRPDPRRPATDYAQYLLLVRDAGMTRPPQP